MCTILLHFSGTEACMTPKRCQAAVHQESVISCISRLEVRAYCPHTLTHRHHPTQHPRCSRPSSSSSSHYWVRSDLHSQTLKHSVTARKPWSPASAPNYYPASHTVATQRAFQLQRLRTLQQDGPTRIRRRWCESFWLDQPNGLLSRMRD